MRRLEKGLIPSFYLEELVSSQESFFVVVSILRHFVMLANTLHTTWGMRFFVLIYLLISVSTSHASFWCHDSESSSHLESNPIGECWAVTPLEEDELLCCEVMTIPGVFLSVQGGDCFDSPVYSSTLTPSNRTSPLSKIATTDIVLIIRPFISFKDSGGARFSPLNLVSQLPHPQALSDLRTVILRH